MVVRRRVIVSGRVQGVFYRDTCRNQAALLGVTGWIANRSDGSVEAELEGRGERGRCARDVDARGAASRRGDGRRT